MNALISMVELGGFATAVVTVLSVASAVRRDWRFAAARARGIEARQQAAAARQLAVRIQLAPAAALLAVAA